jgi:endonuclease/exonuclease/phosphatase family metal-dependent hydrolase
VRDDVDSLANENPDAHIMLMGDFNVTASEEQEVFNDILLKEEWSHRLVEVHQMSRQWFPQYEDRFPDGTYYRGLNRNQWSRFDRIFVSQNMLSGSLQAMIKSYRIIYTQFITGKGTVKNQESGDEIEVRYPLSYNFLEDRQRPLGYSDHLPVSIKLRY